MPACVNRRTVTPTSDTLFRSGPLKATLPTR